MALGDCRVGTDQLGPCTVCLVSSGAVFWFSAPASTSLHHLHDDADEHIRPIEPIVTGGAGGETDTFGKLALRAGWGWFQKPEARSQSPDGRPRRSVQSALPTGLGSLATD